MMLGMRGIVIKTRMLKGGDPSFSKSAGQTSKTTHFSILTSVLLLFLLACKNVGPEEFVFIRVVTPAGDPVVGAVIEGGLDWDYFSVRTNTEGWARLHARALNYGAVIFKNNFFPRMVPKLQETTYVLEPTPDSLVPIGRVSGSLVRFDESTLTTITYGGSYLVYTYSESSIHKVFSQSLPAVAIKHFTLKGDTLWLATHDDGIYVFSLYQPFAPRLLFHLEISGYLRHFEVMDSLLILSFLEGPTRIYGYHPDGTWQEIATLSEQAFAALRVLQPWYVAGIAGGTAVVYDLRDPHTPHIVWMETDPSLYSGLFDGDTLLLLMANPWRSSPPYPYRAIDLSNPEAPVEVATFTAPKEIMAVFSDTLAVASSHEILSVALLRGSLNSEFETTGVISEVGVAAFQGAFPPFFLINGIFWKLRIPRVHP